MTPPVVSPERGAVAPDVLPFWGADHTVPHKKHLTEACKKHLEISTDQAQRPWSSGGLLSEPSSHRRFCFRSGSAG